MTGHTTSHSDSHAHGQSQLHPVRDIWRQSCTQTVIIHPHSATHSDSHTHGCSQPHTHLHTVTITAQHSTAQQQSHTLSPLDTTTCNTSQSHAHSHTQCCSQPHTELHMVTVAHAHSDNCTHSLLDTTTHKPPSHMPTVAHNAIHNCTHSCRDNHTLTVTVAHPHSDSHTRSLLDTATRNTSQSHAHRHTQYCSQSRRHSYIQ